MILGIIDLIRHKLNLLTFTDESRPFDNCVLLTKL